MKEDLLRIIGKYGVSHQLKKLSEEVFEFQEAARDYEEQKRVCEEFCSKLHCDKEREHMIEEFADVCVVLEQFKAYYDLDNEKIIETMKYKIERQKKRMEDEDIK